MTEPLTLTPNDSITALNSPRDLESLPVITNAQLTYYLQARI